MPRSRVFALTALAMICFAAGAVSVTYFGSWLQSGVSAVSPNAEAATEPASSSRTAVGEVSSVELNEKQLASVKVDEVREATFPVEKSAVGSIDFNEDMTVQVFTPYQGRIIELFGKVGDEVAKGQLLFTIDSPDLLNADSNLIAAAGVLELTSKNLERLKVLYVTRAVAQKDLEQGISDQQTAEGNLRTARDAVRIFGKTDAEIDQIVKDRKADPRLVVESPIAGRITARNAAPGLFVQPANPPPPYVVADINTMWMLANVAESDSQVLRVGQPLKVKLIAFPGREFDGKITTIGAMVDPSTRRVLVRSEVSDPQHELRAGMFATFAISTAQPVRAPAVPLAGVVRQADGTQTVWVTADRRRFTKRVVTIGAALLKPVPPGKNSDLPRDGYRQILSGLQVGEFVATDGAIYLDNMANLAAK